MLGRMMEQIFECIYDGMMVEKGVLFVCIPSLL